MNSFYNLILSILLCFFSLLLILHITNISVKQNYKGTKFAFILAIICGIVITLVPYLSLLSANSTNAGKQYLLHLFEIGTVSILFCFICFVLINIMGKIPLRTKMNNSSKQYDKFSFILLSVLGAIYIIGFSYYLIYSLNVSVVLIKEHLIISLVLLASSIYTLARIYEHLYIDKLVIKRKLSLFKISLLFLMFSISLNSSLYIFIISLFLKVSFYMGAVALASSVILLILTIHYIENQLMYQQGQLEYKNRILTINEQHYRSLFENHPDAVFALDSHRNFIQINSSVLPLTGLSFDDLQELTLTDLVIEEEKLKIEAILEEVFKGRNADFETVMRTKNGKIVKLKITALPININKEISGAYFIAQDITEQIETQEKVRYLAYHDELTGLLNRRGIHQNIVSLIDSETLSATILIDIDMFKDINDHLGHVSGDTLLQQVASRLRNTVKSNDLIGRIGGDEFLVCLTGYKNKREVLDLIKKIQVTMNDPFLVQEASKEITLSMGVSFYPEDGEDFNTLIKHADMAMYEAKKLGRNNFVQYSHQFEEEKLKQIVMLQELKIALEQEQLSLNFQPKHCSIHNTILGVETLVRWKHPIKGFISPAEFIPLAEKNGLIMPISNWIIQEACRIYSNWMKIYHVNFHLSLNISPKHFLDESFIGFLLEQIQKYQIPAELIDLEITENFAIENIELTRRKINLLTEKGFQISMDDFGTGYTSLTYLSQFDLDRIKVDRSFINGLPGNRNDSAIVQSLISVAKNLDIIVTAEGVEKEEQLKILKEWGCNEIQGYYYSMPLSEEKLIEYWQGTIQ